MKLSYCKLPLCLRASDKPELVSKVIKTDFIQESIGEKRFQYRTGFISYIIWASRDLYRQGAGWRWVDGRSLRGNIRTKGGILLNWYDKILAKTGWCQEEHGSPSQRFLGKRAWLNIGQGKHFCLGYWGRPMFISVYPDNLCFRYKITQF